VRVASNLTARTLAQRVAAMVHPAAHLNTDQAQAYKAIGQLFASHERIRHSEGQYFRCTADGEQVTTNPD
jgi:hypothetical protein